MLYKNTLLKIRRSIGRYISLLIIVMVGAGFYAGIQITAPNVIKIADNYYKDHMLMDFKIISSMGLTDDDADALNQLSGVSGVVPSYSLDVQSRGGAIRIHAIEDRVNTVRLTAGQMPRSDTECVADNRNYRIGDTIEITDSVDDAIKNVEFTVVGLVESVLYLHDDYGSTTVGNGNLSSFAFINKANFILEAYTEIYVIAEIDNAVSYSDEYKSRTASLNDEIVEIKPDRENVRYDEIYKKAAAIIAENEAELKTETQKAEKEFLDAKNELDNSLQELNDGKDAGIKEFEEAKSTLDENAQKLQNAENELAENESGLKDAINTRNIEFDSARRQIAGAREEINSVLTESDTTADELNVKIIELEAAIVTMQTQLNGLPLDSPEYTALYTEIMKYSGMLDGLTQIKTSIEALNQQERQLEDGVAAFTAEIERAAIEINTAKNEIADSQRLLNEAYEEYYANLAVFNAEMDKNEAKINDGYTQYYEKLGNYNAEIAGAIGELNDAKAEFSSIERPQWYVYNRNAAVGYDELDSALQVVAIVAAIFPLFFILIAMLMASNSMARMITEERGELGILTSLGYKDRDIIFSYIIYVLTASGLGAAIGYFIGCSILPPLIYANFTNILPPLAIEYNMITFGIIFLTTLGLMTLVTIFVCYKELKQSPASLMRPVPPRHGRQILLEKNKFVWKRLSFTWKVTLRNMFRYKKRAFMTIIGVAGCASMLLVAFGIRDSMNGIAQRQYGDIFRYDTMIILKDETREITGKLKGLLDEQQIVDPLLINQSAYTCDMERKLLDIFLVVPQDTVLFEQYFSLKSTLNKKRIALGDGDVVITQRIATVYGLGKGDAVTIKDKDNNYYDLVITDVAENYTSNYIYINALTRGDIMGTPMDFNAVVSNYYEDKTSLSEMFIESGLAVSVVIAADATEKAIDSVKSLNGVIVLISIVALILAVVVLYNLTAINISERTREIATLKVLGFRDGENNAYIYREAVFLTLISIGVGMVLGIILHRFVVDIIEINALSLYKKIEWASYVMACIITMFFSFFMQILTYFKLKKIDMVESLKSVE